MLSIDEINLLKSQNERLKKQNKELQKENKELKRLVNIESMPYATLEIEIKEMKEHKEEI